MAKYVKKIICFANSKKISGRCVAGKELVEGKVGQWVRPISDRKTGELSWGDRRLSNGQEPSLMDVLNVTMLEKRPHGYQTENHLIDKQSYWQFDRQATWEEVAASVDGAKSPLWNDQSSSYYGVRDRIAEAVTAEIVSSLKLLDVSNFEIRVVVEGAEFGNPRKRIRGRFLLGKTEYVLSITDPAVLESYRNRKEGTYAIDRAILCVSLGELHEDGYAYKLIAGIMLPPA